MLSFHLFLHVLYLPFLVNCIIFLSISHTTKLLKSITNEIVLPVTLIINQYLTTGIFPDKLKVAKVIPIFKKGDKTKFDNYRPISILPAI